MSDAEIGHRGERGRMSDVIEHLGIEGSAVNSKSFTDGKCRIATESDLKARWACGKPGERFRCYICGHKFTVGDQWRFVYAGDVKCLNAIVCANCDGPDVKNRWAAICWEFYHAPRFWALKERS